MLLIAHRGNIQGPVPALENSPAHIQRALDAGFCVEIDLRVKKNKLYLGHDYAQYKIEESYLIENKNKFWVHCKDKEALEKAIKMNLNCFWHNVDDYTITNYGYVWCFPGKKPISSRSITVLPELYENVKEMNVESLFAVCSDYVLDIQNI